MISRTNSTRIPRGGRRSRPCPSSLTPYNRAPCRASWQASRAWDSVGFVQDLVDHGLGLLLRASRGEHELGHEDLAGLGEHPLLTGRQALLAFADREVPDDFRHLIDVARAQFLDVVLEPTAPVRGHLGLVLAQDVEDLGDFLLGHDVAKPDVLRAVDRDHQGEIAVRQAQDEVLLAFPEEVPFAKVFNDSGAVFRMNYRVAFSEHQTTSPAGTGGESQAG